MEYQIFSYSPDDFQNPVLSSACSIFCATTWRARFFPLPIFRQDFLNPRGGNPPSLLAHVCGQGSALRQFINELINVLLFQVSKIVANLVTGKSVKADGRGWRSTNAKLKRLKQKMSLFEDINNPAPSDETYTQRRLFDIVTDSGNYHSKINKQELDAHLQNKGNPLTDTPLLKEAMKVL
jgi:hypothetical protein